MWSRRRPRWRFVAAGLLVAVLSLGYFGLVDLLSRPKPLRLELAGLNDARVISAVLREDEAIYLWLNVDDVPRFFTMPWDKKLALELQRTMREARRSGADVALRNQAEREAEVNEDDENPHVDTFYAVPQASRPPEKRPVIVRGPGWEM
jgi:hypothetical protein